MLTGPSVGYFYGDNSFISVQTHPQFAYERSSFSNAKAGGQNHGLRVDERRVPSFIRLVLSEALPPWMICGPGLHCKGTIGQRQHASGVIMTCYGIDPTVQTSATEQWPEGPHLQTEDTMLPSAMCDGRKFAPSHHFLSAAGRTIRTVAVSLPTRADVHLSTVMGSVLHLWRESLRRSLGRMRDQLTSTKTVQKSIIMACCASMSKS